MSCDLAHSFGIIHSVLSATPGRSSNERNGLLFKGKLAVEMSLNQNPMFSM